MKEFKPGSRLNNLGFYDFANSKLAPHQKMLSIADLTVSLVER